MTLAGRTDMSDRLAQRMALAVPALLLAGAYVSQYGYGLFPCEMCWWQRYAHFAALALALVSLVARPRRVWVALAGLGIFASGVIGLFHAGVEYGWWDGFTSCASAVGSGGGSALDNILNTPVIRCDVAPWHFLGISLAGWNGLLSIGSGCAIWGLVLVKERKR